MTAFTVLPIDDIKSTGTPLNLYSTEIQFNDKGKVVNLNQQVEDFNYLTKKKPFKQPIQPMIENYQRRKVYTSQNGRRRRIYAFSQSFNKQKTTK